MSYQDFSRWLNTKRTVNVLIMDGAEVLAEVKNVKVMTSSDLNNNNCPTCLKIFSSNGHCNTHIDIGSRYINQIIETGEYWSVFVDGYQHYLFS